MHSATVGLQSPEVRSPSQLALAHHVGPIVGQARQLNLVSVRKQCDKGKFTTSAVPGRAVSGHGKMGYNMFMFLQNARAR